MNSRSLSESTGLQNTRPRFSLQCSTLSSGRSGTEHLEYFGHKEFTDNGYSFCAGSVLGGEVIIKVPQIEGVSWRTDATKRSMIYAYGSGPRLCQDPERDWTYSVLQDDVHRTTTISYRPVPGEHTHLKRNANPWSTRRFGGTFGHQQCFSMHNDILNQAHISVISQLPTPPRKQRPRAHT